MPEQGLPPEQEGLRRRPVGAESTPGGVGSPLGSETLETRPLPALDALLQTDFMEVLPSVKGLKDLQPHAESHEPFGDDRVLAFGPLYLHDLQYDEYIEAGMADADGNTVLFTIGAYNAALTFGLSLARNVTDRAGAFLNHFNANLWDPVFMHIGKSHTGTPGVQPDMDNASVSRLNLLEHDIVGVRRLEFQDTDESAGNDISVQQRGDAAGAILEIVNNDDATQYSSPTYRRLRLADPVGADDAATKRYVDGLSYAGHALLDGSLHTDTLAGAVVDGDVAIGNATPKWSRLAISVPAVNVRNVLGVDNGELRPSWKAALDATNPVNAGGAAAPGTSLIFSHRDHVHAVAATHSGSTHHGAVAIGADAAHSLATQVLSAVLAANGQTGHMSSDMFDKLDGIEAGAEVTSTAKVDAAGAVMDSDISPGEGFLRKTGAGTYTAHKSNLSAAAAPDADEDSADGYSVGSLWIDTTNDNVYVCVDATEAAAVWRHLDAAAAAHDHTAADGSGVLTNDEHDGYSEYAEIAIPSAPAASKGRLFTPLLTSNDSLSPGTDETGLFYRRNDGLMVKVNDDFPYSRKLRHCYSATAPHGDTDETELENSWINFAYTYASTAFTQDFLGCVWIQGMIKSGTITASAFTLPEGHRDTDGRLVFPSVSNGALGRNDLHTGGTVEPEAGNNAYVSLMFVAEPADGRITWHSVGGGGEPAFENSWVNVGSGYTGASFAKDAIGRVWIRGLVKSGGANTTVFTLPVGYRPTADIHRIILVNNNVIGRLKILSDGTVVVNVLGGTNAWASITAVFTADGAATWTAATFENSWVNFGGTYDTAAFYKDACGIVHIKGLIKDGTVGATAFTLPVGCRPKQRLFLPVISNDAFGNMDVYEDGTVKASVGNNAWFTVHCSFVAEQ